MATNFPTSVDNFTNPTANDSLNLPSHSTQHANANDAIEAIETYALTLPRGYLNRALGTATTGISAGVALSVLNFDVTIVAGRLYEIGGRIAVQASSNSGPNALYISTSGATPRTLEYQTTAIGTNLNKSFGGKTTMSAAEFSVTSGTATKNIALFFKCGATGSLSTNPDSYVAANSFPQELWIMDIGVA